MLCGMAASVPVILLEEPPTTDLLCVLDAWFPTSRLSTLYWAAFDLESGSQRDSQVGTCEFDMFALRWSAFAESHA